MKKHREFIIIGVMPEIKELLKDIAKIEGKTMTEILIEGIYEKAEKIKNKRVSAYKLRLL